jgi:hypothetical protein
VVHTTEVEVEELTGQLTPPIVTEGETKPDPLMLTTTPPAVEPEEG